MATLAPGELSLPAAVVAFASRYRTLLRGPPGQGAPLNKIIPPGHGS